MIKYRSLFVTFYKIIQRQCANCSIGDGLFVADRAGRSYGVSVSAIFNNVDVFEDIWLSFLWSTVFVPYLEKHLVLGPSWIDLHTPCAGDYIEESLSKKIQMIARGKFFS
jgi:hypothetical protein